MQEHYERLGLAPDATLDDVKIAYHAKLREFPAHTHPQEFKAIRVAYEALRKGSANLKDFFDPQNEKADIDPDLLAQLRQAAIAQATVSLEELMHLTF
ncbi:MAG: molecular chaperone DnaJ [Thermosynechococcaceae cyanobacterium]